MQNIDKQEILNILEVHPNFFIGKEFLSNDKLYKIKDVNLKSTHFLVENRTTSCTLWIKVDSLEDKITFDNFSTVHPIISVKTIMDLLNKDKEINHNNI